MGMKNSLTCGFSAIDADIESFDGRVTVQDQGLKLFNQVMGIASFITGHMKIVGTMAFRNDEHMVEAHGGAVFDDECGLVLKDDTKAFCPAKRAWDELYLSDLW